MLWGAPGDACGVPRAHHARGAINSDGKQVGMLPWLCGRFESPKRPAGPGEGARRLWSRAHAPSPLQASQSSVSRDGSLPGGGQQQQDERRRRISLSGCFLKITLPLSAGQGCSRLNNRSRPALPCSRALAGSPSPGCAGWMLDHSPLGSIAVPEGWTSHKGQTRCIPHPAAPKSCCWGCPELTPAGLGGSRESCRRNGSARGRSHRVFAKTAESRSNYSLNVSTVVAGMKDAHMSPGRDSPALPPLKGRNRSSRLLSGAGNVPQLWMDRRERGGDGRNPGQNREAAGAGK